MNSQGGPPAVVFVHASRLTGAMWQPQVEALSGEFHVLAPDLPGHGRLAGERFSLAGAANHLARVIDEEAGGRALLVGLSLGGYVALDFAARFPERASGLLLASCSAEGRYPLSLPYLLTGHLMGRSPALRAAQERALRRELPREAAAILLAEGLHLGAMGDVLREVLRRNWRATLRGLNVPVLLVNGERDHLFRLDERRFLRVARRGQLRHVAGAAHLCNLQQPEVFTQIVREFAREL